MMNFERLDADGARARRQRLLDHWSLPAAAQLRQGGIWRDFRPNLHRIAAQAWRSAQPSPWTLHRLHARHGLRTVVNLRGDQGDSRSGRIEREVCERIGLNYTAFKVKSREMPSRETLLALRDLMSTIEHPVLFHCKAGADRVGLVSALYLHWVHGVPIERARRQLRFIPFGHVPFTRTGVLDHLFACYLESSRDRPMDFTTWVTHHYDRQALARTFRPGRIVSAVVHGVLARE